MWSDEFQCWMPVRDIGSGARSWAWQNPSELLEHEHPVIRRFAGWMQKKGGNPHRLHYQRMTQHFRRHWVETWLKVDRPSPATLGAWGGIEGIVGVVLAVLNDELPELE